VIELLAGLSDYWNAFRISENSHVKGAEMALHNPVLRWTGGIATGVMFVAALLVAQENRFANEVGSITLAMLSAAAAGTLIGFLFGIPRFLSSAPGGNTSQAGSYRSNFSHNTNLEQISDWLTKILVGVGLVEAKKIFVVLGAISEACATAWGWQDGAVIAGFLLTASALIGFLVTYIWTRTDFNLYLEQNQSDVEKEISGRLVKVEAERDEARKNEERAKEQANQAVTSLQKAVRFVGGGTAAAELLSVDTRSDSTWNSDPNKDKFGSSPVANGLRLSAEVSPLSEDGQLCAIRLWVTAEGDRPPLHGLVRFFLHPTFPRQEMQATAVDGVAELRLVAAGAFTVGAETEDGIRLELDLAQLPDIPEAFRKS